MDSQNQSRRERNLKAMHEAKKRMAAERSRVGKFNLRQKTGHLLRKQISLGVALVLSLGSVCVGIGVYDRFIAQKIAAYDLQGFFMEQKRLYVDGKLTKDQFNQKIKQMEAAAQKLPHNYVVLMGDAVIRGAAIPVDLTK